MAVSLGADPSVLMSWIVPPRHAERLGTAEAIHLVVLNERGGVVVLLPAIDTSVGEHRLPRHNIGIVTSRVIYFANSGMTREAKEPRTK